MARLADRVGVSRQTVYNEVGSKPELAGAMVLDELTRFLAVVEGAFDAHPDDLLSALRTAVRGVLARAADSPLLRAVVASANGAPNELLPPLTTDAASLIDTATTVLVRRLSAYPLGLGTRELASAADVIVRTVLSHVMRPSGTTPTQVRRSADGVAWAAHRLLATPTA
jgi:AcrR family transcriptional regulator